MRTAVGFKKDLVVFSRSRAIRAGVGFGAGVPAGNFNQIAVTPDFSGSDQGPWEKILIGILRITAAV
jgi:hypothetical protein